MWDLESLYYSYIRLGFKYYFTPFSAKILPHSWRCEAAVYQILGKCPRQRRHCSNANIARLLSKIWSSILIGFDRSHAMYFCQISTYYETIWRRIPWNARQKTKIYFFERMTLQYFYNEPRILVWSSPKKVYRNCNTAIRTFYHTIV